MFINGEITEVQFAIEVDKYVPQYTKELIDSYNPNKSTENSSEIDTSKPSILLTSYVGAKGLSGGHVFTLGMYNGNLPRNKESISDVEISQFLVALTRTRKKFYALSNRWFNSPVAENGTYRNSFEKSEFLNWLPKNLIENRGYLKSGDIK